MAAQPQSEPRTLQRSISNWWWLERRNYLIFILREFSSVFVAYFLLVTLAQLCALPVGSISRNSANRSKQKHRNLAGKSHRAQKKP